MPLIVLRDGVSGIRRHTFSPKYHDQFCVQCFGIRMLFGAQIKPLLQVIIIYSIKPEEFVSAFLVVNISHAD